MDNGLKGHCQGYCKVAGRHTRRPRRSRGQSLVEFALVVPLFILIVTALAEFAFVVGAMSATSMASREGAQLGAEAGNAAWADCVILQRVERDVASPASASNITEVDIFWADRNGKVLGANVWTRSGSTNCTDSASNKFTVPYTLNPEGYKIADRCSTIGATDCNKTAGHTGLDMIGVRVDYNYHWITPIQALLNWYDDEFNFSQSSSFQMEPVR